MKKNISIISLIFYSLPMIAGGAMNMLIALYLMKYSTDALLIAPAVMGSLFLISRIWDAVNDPIIGFLSDHTPSRYNRRKIWILLSALPVGITFYFLWMPPEPIKEMFMGIALMAFYTFFTTLYVPHYSLGAELSSVDSDRHKIYGIRAVAENIGIFAAVGVMLLIPVTSQARAEAPMLMFIVAIVSIILVASMHFFVKEEKHQKIPQAGFIKSFSSVFKNSHARLILTAGFFGQFGAAVIFTMTLYFAEYVIKVPDAGNLVVGIFIISASITIPLWIFLLKHFEKKTIWIGANLVLAMCFALTFTLHEGNIDTLYLIAAFAGAASGSILFIHPSALADTIDYEELLSGHKSQGMYFSIFTFINKTAMGMAAFVIGRMLKLGEFQPNIDQSEDSLFFIKFTYAFIPAISFSIASVLLTFYSLNRESHQNIRMELDKRKGISKN
jgi:Na+/melibiose symporter-like transporter